MPSMSAGLHRGSSQALRKAFGLSSHFLAARLRSQASSRAVGCGTDGFGAADPPWPAQSQLCSRPWELLGANPCTTRARLCHRG